MNDELFGPDPTTPDPGETATTEVEVWRLAHKIGAEYAAMFNMPQVPQIYRDGIADYRNYVEKVLAKAGYPVGGPNDSIKGD